MLHSGTFSTFVLKTVACWIQSASHTSWFVQFGVSQTETVSLVLCTPSGVCLFLRYFVLFSEARRVVISSEGNAWAAVELWASVSRSRRALFSSVCWLGCGPGSRVLQLSHQHSHRLTKAYSEKWSNWEERGRALIPIRMSGKKWAKKIPEMWPWTMNRTGQTGCHTGNTNNDCIRWPNRWPHWMTSFMVNTGVTHSIKPVQSSVKVHGRNGAIVIFLPRVDKDDIFFSLLTTCKDFYYCISAKLATLVLIQLWK